MKVPVILGVLCLIIGYGHSCYCPKIPTNGCKSQYSILGTVIAALPIGIPPDDERIYTVLVQRIYKADQPLPPLVQIRAYVAGNYCGLLLTPGSQYVISGSYSGFTLRTNHCWYTRLFSLIPPIEQMNLDCPNRHIHRY